MNIVDIDGIIYSMT